MLPVDSPKWADLECDQGSAQPIANGLRDAYDLLANANGDESKINQAVDLASHDASLTREGVIAGTPRYMSPEQATGQSVTQSTDLFSLGSVLYAMATGRPPFRAESSYVVMRMICEEQPTPVRELNPNIPAWLSGTIEKLMEKEPADRFQSARHVSELLEGALAHVQQPTNVPLPFEVERLAQSKKSSLFSKKVIVMIASVSAVLAAFGFLLSALPGGIFPQSFSSNDKGFPNVALFQDAKVIGEADERRLRVVHDGTWYTVVSIGEVSSKELFDFADEHIETAKVNKRVIEDLPVVFHMMEKPLTIPTPVQLESEDGSIVSANIIATKENRFALLRRDRKKLPKYSAGQKKESLFEDAMVKKGTDGQELHVLLEGQWHKVVSIAGVTSHSLFNFAEKNLGTRKATQRITEDLPLVFQMMEKPLPQTATVELETKDGVARTVDIRSSEENRNSLMNKRREREKAQAPKKTRLDRSLNFADLEKDVRYFQENLQARFAYLKAKNKVDLEAECNLILAQNPKGIRPSKLAAELQEIMAQFIDGHARVEHRASQSRPEQATPFLIEPIGDRFVAFLPSRESFVDPKFPYLNKIDGLAVEKLIKPFESMIAKGSPQYVLRQKLRLVRDLGLARELSGIEPSDEIRLELSNADGQTKQITRYTSAAHYPSYRTWPRRTESKILDNNIGYLRLEGMDSDARDLVHDWLPRFKNTDGLIVDVRDNGGGTREALIELASHLMQPSDEPRIANVAKFRLHKRHERDHLESRFAYRVDSVEFNEKKQRTINKFANSFQPEWQPNASQFSQWHYLVLANDADSPRPFYNKPVVTLMNQKCFSATDIFLGAFKGWPNVTLVGQPSGGGSARSESFSLPMSECRIRCASMASFQPNGKLYDSNGVQPDVVVEPTPEYFLNGSADPFLSKALDLLKSGKASK